MKRALQHLAVITAAIWGRIVAVAGIGDPIKDRFRRYASPQDPVMARLARYCSS
jgi:hypothetical protein